MQQVKFGMTASWAVSLVLLFGCGGGSSDGGKPSAAQVKDACVKICQKQASCEGLTLDCATFCTDNSNMSGAVPPACNTNATLNKIQTCVDGACSALDDCLSDATSACSSGTGGSGSGTGGRTGTGGLGSSTGGLGSSTGGRIGTGGTSSSTGGLPGVGGAGSGDCSVCTKASACCIPLLTQLGQDTASCASFSAAMCTSAGAGQSTLITACQQMLATGVTLGIAACM